MESSEVATWAAVFVALMGPIIGVIMADTYSKRQSQLSEAANVFRSIMKNSQAFLHAFLDRHRFESQLKSSTDKLNQLQQMLRSFENSTDANSISLVREAQRLLTFAMEDTHNTQERFHNAFQESRNIEVLLNVDKLSLGLLFGMKSEKCGRAINHLIVMSEIFKTDPLPPLTECDKEINDRIQKISQEMKSLHNSLINPENP